MDLAKDKIMEGDCRTVTVKSDFYRECGTSTKCFHKKIAALITAVNTMALTSIHLKIILLIADALSTMAKIAPVNAASPEKMLIERSKTGLSSEVVLLLQSTCADAGIELELDSGRSVQ